MAREKKKPVGDGIDEAVGNVEAATFGGDVIPDAIKVGVGL
jgi:hypothetical protein